MRINSRLRLADACTDTVQKLLEGLVTVRIARFADVVARLAAQAVTTQVGVPYIDLRLLSLLDGTDSVTVNEIARGAHMTVPG
jgi:hypothetical protein